MRSIQNAAYFEPNTRFSVSLDGVEGLDTAIKRGELYADGNFRIRKGGREPSSFDWEMYTLHESGALARTTFYKNGKVAPNPFG
jgi:hypothetical protein